MAKIGFLGIGAMGSRMAARLIAAGHDLTVWNRTPAALEPLLGLGAAAAATPAAAVSGADFVMSMVRDDEASRAVWTGDDGALSAIHPDAVALECSTLSLGRVRELSAIMAGAGRLFLDAPVAGSLPQAEGGDLVFLVGGSDKGFKAGAAIFDCLGRAAHHIGDNGAGMAAKLVVNAMLAVQAVWMSETVGMLRRAGLDAEDILAAALKTPVFGPASHGLAASILSKDFEPRFPLELAYKDIRYALAASNAEMPIAGAAFGALSEAVGAGYGSLQLTAVSQLFD